MGTQYREESDSMGTINVPENAYWGAQTQDPCITLLSAMTVPAALIQGTD